MKAEVYNTSNKVVGEVELPDAIFGAKWNPVLVKQVVEAQLANKRRPWAHAKTRAEVRGGGRKPWRQKGTGRARHGSTRSPLWVGGGKSHGPSKDRDYSEKVNKKMKRAALFSTLSKKLKDGEMKVFESIALEEPKTKQLAAMLAPLVAMKKGAKKYDILLLAGTDNKNVMRAISNIPKAKASHVESVNVYDLLNHKNLFVEKAAIAGLAKHFKAV